MEPSLIAFSIYSYFPQGFDLPSFQAAIEAAPIGVTLISCEVGQFTTQDPDDPEVGMTFEDRLDQAAVNEVYAVVDAYQPPAP